MRLKPFPENESNISNLRLVIGLFCGWALSWKELKRLLVNKLGSSSLRKLDIPPSRYHFMEAHTESGIIKISMDEIRPCIKPACQYCFDMTAEFSDISVGSARLPEGWDEAKSWNQIIVRTDIGDKLIELAKKRRVLEFRSVPEGNLDRLKQAALEKKKRAVMNLAKKSGNNQDLIYLDYTDPDFSRFVG
jgi:coenzyme F420 hydrogenase subunit beta